MVKPGKAASGKKQLKRASKTMKTVKAKKTDVLQISRDASLRELPSGYNIDTIVLMPVNTDTSFIYWELTDTLLHGNNKKLQSGAAQLIIKVFETDCLKEVCSFEVQERVGSSYINYKPSFKQLTAEIGISNGKGYVGLLKTRSDASPSFIPSSTGGTNTQNAPLKKNRQGLNRKTTAASSEVPAEIWMTNSPDGAGITSVPFSDSCHVMEKIIDYYSTVSDSHETSFSIKPE